MTYKRAEFQKFVSGMSSEALEIIAGEIHDRVKEKYDKQAVELECSRAEIAVAYREHKRTQLSDEQIKQNVDDLFKYFSPDTFKQIAKEVEQEIEKNNGKDNK